MKTTIPQDISEKTSAMLTCILADETGSPISNADIDTLVLSQFVQGNPQAIINGRNGQNVLNTNDVTLDAAGVLTWSMTPGDTVIVDGAAKTENHVARFTWTWASGSRTGRHEIIYSVTNLRGIS